MGYRLSKLQVEKVNELFSQLNTEELYCYWKFDEENCKDYCSGDLLCYWVIEDLSSKLYNDKVEVSKVLNSLCEAFIDANYINYFHIPKSCFEDGDLYDFEKGKYGLSGTFFIDSQSISRLNK